MKKDFLKKILGFINNNSSFFTMIILIVISALIFPKFLTKQNINAILKQYSIIGFLALGQFLVILTGGIDLSQGSMVAFTSIIIAYFLQTNSLVSSVLIAITLTTILGLINGLLVAKTKIPPFIVTLGMLGITRGLALVISDTKPITISSEELILFGKESFLGVPIIFIVWILFGFLMDIFLKNRKLGRYIYATGGSEESARLSGVNVKRIKAAVYTFCAFSTALGGIIWAARLRSGSPIGGVNYELESIATVLVGGGSLFGGIGSVFGTVSGVLTFGVINSSLNMARISPYWQGMLKGIIILITVAISQLRLVGGTKR
jgi:ribose/xylose/arabinose/galactoside ABC-type transport system permease subunit